MRQLTAFTTLVVVVSLHGLVFGQLSLVTNLEPQRIFFGQKKSVSIIVHNLGDQSFAGEIHARIWQTSSATAVLFSENAGKQTQVPVGETVLTYATLDFPPVKAEAKFLVQWLENSNSAFGTTEILAYPTNLLEELKPLAGDEPLGVFDPQNQLKPLLKTLKLDFTDLENSGLENFSGRLAIIGPFSTKAQMHAGLVIQIKALMKRGVAIVWLQPPPEPTPNRWQMEKLQPSFYSVSENTNAVVIVQPELVANLAENPQSQLNLIYFCKLALHPQPPVLPDLSAQP